MSDTSSRKLPKIPFYLADLVLSAIAFYVLYRLGRVAGPWEVAMTAICLAAAAWGAWLSITPWFAEYKAEMQLSEASDLRKSLDRFDNIEGLVQQVQNANSNWQQVQDISAKTVASAREISERMTAETQSFMNFLQQANDQERNHLRLELDKSHRMQTDWIQVTVRILDHIFALNAAAAKSGQPGLIEQLSNFQHACRDIARRVGLSPFVAAPGEKFDEKAHQLAEPGPIPGEGIVIHETIATGYTFQGQLLRRAVVRVGPADALQEEEKPAKDKNQLGLPNLGS